MTPLDSMVDVYRGRVTQEFDSLEKLGLHLVASVAAWKLARRAALKDACEMIKVDARKQIGVYQQAVGDYPEWAPLAESTIEQKESAGFDPKAGMDDDAPLFREGDLLKSFRSTIVSENEAIVGSTDLVMTYHEFGTNKMPPRPVLGPALVKNIDKIQARLAGAILDAVLVGQHMGYRLSTGEGGPDE